MATLLQVKSSIFGDNGQSAQLAAMYVAQWQEKYPAGDVVVRDVVADSVPHLDLATVGALMTPDDERSAEQQAIVNRSDELIAEIKAADQIIIGVPMYNFGIPSQLKAYFDLLARAGVTFKYTENGPVGLLDDKPVVLFATRGGFHKDQGDHQIPYVKQYLGFIGLSSVETVYAEGLNIGEDVAKAELAKAHQVIAELL